jgi:anti-anti-sigma factor
MQPGQILVAEHSGVFVIKMVGDVRLTLCLSFDQFIESMFSHPDFTTVLFDLSGAEAVDSTTLGLMAKISLLGEQKLGVYPVVLSTNEGVNRTLETMGFADIFTIVSDLQAPLSSVEPAQPIELSPKGSETQIKDTVVEAHRYLMQLNEANKETFTDLVNMLESEQ